MTPARSAKKPLNENERHYARMVRVLALAPTVYSRGGGILYPEDHNRKPHWTRNLPPAKARLFQNLTKDERRMLWLIQAIVCELDKEMRP